MITNRILYLTGFIILLSGWSESFGQISYVQISGPSTSDLDQQKTYEALFYNSYNTLEDPPTANYDAFWYIPVGAGTPVNPSDFSTTVRWTQSGTHNLQFDLTTWDNYYWDDLDVVVSTSGIVAPNLNAASDETTSSFVASWNEITGAASYRLEVALDDDFTNFLAGYSNYSLTSTSLMISALDPGTVYHFRVRAVSSAGAVSNYSNSMSALTVPAAPVLGQVTGITSTSFTAHWNSVIGATRYAIEIADNQNFSPVLNYFDQITGASFTKNGLIQSTEYYYRVRAINSSGPSLYSAAASVTTAPGPPPIPVAAEATDITSSSFRANWNAAVTATGYRVDVSTTPDFSSFVGSYHDLVVSATNATVTGLTDRTSYYYRVRSANQFGVSDNSQTILAANFDRNFIRAVDVTVPNKTRLGQVDSALVHERTVKVDFFDGLGRPDQTVLVQSSPLQNDIVQPVVYDVYGRETKKYLPYAANESNGFYKPVTYTGSGNYTHDFYNNTSDAIADDSRPFHEVVFEASPLSRPVKEYGPGADWGPESSNKFIEHQYKTNQYGTGAGQEQIIAWKLDNEEVLVREEAREGYVEQGGYYSTGQLYVKVTVDEHGNAVRVYTNKQGKLILKKTQAITNSTNLNNFSEWACTYYVYDDYGNLVSVLPPEAIKSILSAAQY